MLSDLGNYLWKHKQKILLSGAVVAGTVGLFLYYGSDSSTVRDETRENSVISTGERIITEADSVVNRAKQLPENKRRHLAKIRLQFENAREKFLPALRVKINEIADYSETILEIRKIRSNVANSVPNSFTEEELWDKMKGTLGKK